MVMLSRKTGLLLKTVLDKPHASDEDHFETAQNSGSTSSISADPISSDDEASTSLPEPAKRYRSVTNRNNRPGIRPPRPGQYISREEATGKTLREDGNTTNSRRALSGVTTVQPSMSMRTPNELEDDFSAFGSSRPNKKRKVTGSRSFQNMHAKPITTSTVAKYGSSSIGYCKSSKPKWSKASATRIGPDPSDSDDSDVSMIEPKTLSRPGALQSAPNKQNSRALTKDGMPSPRSTKTRPSTFSLQKYSTSQKSKPSPSAFSGSTKENGRHREKQKDRDRASSPKRVFDRPEPSSNRTDLGLQATSSDCGSPLSSAPPSPAHTPRPTKSETPEYELSSQGPRCPMCHEPVEEDHFYRFVAAHPRMTFRAQDKFCHEHKKHKAEKEYNERGYPTIRWGAFNDRIADHWPELESVLLGKSSSHHRDQHEEKATKGEDRTLLSALGKDEFTHSSTGYYGARGARAMMEAITKNFAPQIRELAPKDKVIAFGGISNFVQAVLVPELATLLVMEDLKVDEDRAREIIAESGAIGDLVHEEEDDATIKTRSGRTISVHGSQETDEEGN